MGKRNILAPPRGGINLHLSKRQARKVLKALNGPSCTDADLADVYDGLSAALTASDEEAKRQ